MSEREEVRPVLVGYDESPASEQALRWGMESVRRTHRAVIVDEAWRSGNISAEVSARITEQAFYDLDAPVERVCGAEVPAPYARHLEEAALPRQADVVAAARRAADSDA